MIKFLNFLSEVLVDVTFQCGEGGVQRNSLKEICLPASFAENIWGCYLPVELDDSFTVSAAMFPRVPVKNFVSIGGAGRTGPKTCSLILLAYRGYLTTGTENAHA
jgi:hypothetical protein